MREPVFRREKVESRLDSYVDLLAVAVGHADRAAPLATYLSGLLGEGERKSVEPMAARADPRHASPRHQSLLHFVGQSPWSDAAVLRVARDYALPVIERHGEIDAWIVDDTAIVKKGMHSVGVARQWCGRLGKQENCQDAVSLSVANESASLPIGYRLYLPESWAEDADRRKKAHVPEEIEFETKPKIALGLIRDAIEQGVRPGVVVADAGYGGITDFRDGLTALSLTYVVEVKSSTAVRVDDAERPLLKGMDFPEQLSVRELALGLPKSCFRPVVWRQGTAEKLRSRFAAVRVRPAHRRPGGGSREVEWLLAEWPSGESEPTRYALSTLPAEANLETLVRFNKCRWRIERDYEELKGELGLHHFEGRSWRGFHHHASLCIAAFAFLAAERGLSPPGNTHTPRRLPAPLLPRNFRPRGSPDPT